MQRFLSSSWMNSQIPSLLLPLEQNESCAKLYIGVKKYVTCMFIRTCETFCTSNRSANGNSDVEVKSA